MIKILSAVFLLSLTIMANEVVTVEPVTVETSAVSAVIAESTVMLVPERVSVMTFVQYESYYSEWAIAAETETAFPSEVVPFAFPGKALMLELTDPVEVDALVYQAITARLNGFAVYFGYTPRQAGMETFPAMNVLAAIEKLATVCDGFAPAYRRSGAHYTRINQNIAAKFCEVARAGNSNIQLLGEAYWGELYSGEIPYGVSIFTFPGCVALLGVNVHRCPEDNIEGLPVIEVFYKKTISRFQFHVYADISVDN